jgi:hypothetical protein
MELEIADPAFRERLDAPAYRVRQHNGLSYWNARLVRRDVAARYVGATHEYLSVDGRSAISTASLSPTMPAGRGRKMTATSGS